MTVSINIEGGEYTLLEQIINSGLINQINNLQIQFHDFFPDSQNKRKEIINKLFRTHETIFSFPFVWEGFRKRQLEI